MHDLGEEGYFHFITMEYVAGEDLKRFIRRAGTLSSGKAVNIAKQVCEGLAEAHRLGVIHRDLKPQNIMIDQDGNAKIMDFGIARFVDTDRMTGSGVMIGTPEYMSPEQVELKDVDKRADIYALGIVLYEMVTGRVPFEGETPLSIAMKHKTEKAKNVRELNPQVSAGLAGIISKCMEKDPGNRYQSAEELLEALNKAEQELATGERIVPKKEPISTKEITVTFQVKKLVVPAAAVILLVIIALAVWKFLPRKESAVPPVQTNEAAVQKPDPAKQQSDSATQKTDAATVTPKTAQSTDKTVPKKESVPPSAPAQKQPEIKETKTRDAGTGSAAEAKKDEAKTQAEQPKAAAQDSDMNSATLAMARVTGARSQAQKGGLSVKDLFFRLAEAKAQEGQKFLTQKSPVEARSLLVVAERLFRISLDKNKDEDRLSVLKNFVENLREDIEDKKIVSPGNKLYDSAKESEKQAAAFLAKKDIENSAKAYIQASAIYEKFLLSYQPPKNK
jgi:serine/threonine protein kinase